MFKALRMNRKK